MMRCTIYYLLVSSFLLCLFLANPVHGLKKSYIVYLGAHSHGPNPSVIELESASKSHYDLLGSTLGSREKAKEALFYSYTRHINGFAAVLEEEEAAEVAKNPNVVSVFLNRRHEPQTTKSWEFLGLEKNGVVPSDSAWVKGKYGEDIIIGNLDSGVWPESKSFSENGMRPIPSKWHGGGICQINNLGNSKENLCNKKLIGARFFNKGYEQIAKNKGEKLPAGPEFNSARDYDGHGTHTLSTAGGNFVPGVSVFGFDFGTAKGGSPKAHVAAYKVCWPSISATVRGGCFDADILAAFDAAISDGVDVISASVGGEPEKLYEDGIAIGSFHAVAKGIVVVSSAGNDGPKAGTVGNIAPWIFTVAASTIDREFVSYVELGNKKRLKGASLTNMDSASSKLYPLISAEDAKLANAKAAKAKSCIAGTLDPNKVKGKILVCLNADGTGSATKKGEQALLAGAVGMILANDYILENIIEAEPHVLPASHLTYTDGVDVYNYIKLTTNPTAKISKAQINLGVKPAPVMAPFSSAGPNTIHPSILKPDITAPGVSIIAAYSEAVSPTNLESDKRRVPFMSLSGTSMSCPHVSGVAGLLKTLYPNWSSAAIRSAIMTTATTLDNRRKPILDSFDEEATPLNYGSGHLDPNFAMNPGLVYDLGIDDYLNFLCGSGYSKEQIKLIYKKDYNCPQSYSIANFNYPSITVLDLAKSSVSVTRTATNVGSSSTYKVHANEPNGISISVEPSSLTFTNSGEKKTFKVSFTPKDAGKSGEYVFGDLSWSDGKHLVTSPIVIKRK